MFCCTVDCYLVILSYAFIVRVSVVVLCFLSSFVCVCLICVEMGSCGRGVTVIVMHDV